MPRSDDSGAAHPGPLGVTASVGVSDCELKFCNSGIKATPHVLDSSAVLRNLLAEGDSAGSVRLPVSVEALSAWLDIVVQEQSDADLYHTPLEKAASVVMAADALADNRTIERVCAAKRGDVGSALGLPKLSWMQYIDYPRDRCTLEELNQALAALSPDLTTALFQSAVAPHLTARITYHGRICVAEGLAEMAPNLHPSVSLLHACAPCIDADSNLYLAINGNAQMQLLRSALPALGHLTRLRLYLPHGHVWKPKGIPGLHPCVLRAALPAQHATHNRPQRRRQQRAGRGHPICAASGVVRISNSISRIA
eukprot:jgi/Ulvmu1/12300/UM088_0019.1